jgi:protocatechuate 3,4-dioxygenase beta subunit
MTQPIELKRQITIAHGQKEVLLEIPVPVGSIAGTIRNTAGEGIGGARIEVRPMSSWAKTAAEQDFFERLAAQWNTRGGSDGSYKVEGLPDGAYAVTVVIDGYALTSRIDVAVASGATAGIDFTMAAGQTVVLTVTDPEGKPVAGALIQALSTDGKWVYSGSEPWMGPGTNGAGQWTTTSGLGQWTFVILHPRHPRKYVPVTIPAQGEPVKVAIQLERGWDVLITVTDAAGAPVRGARVDLIDAQGRVFEMNGTVALLSGALTTSSEGTVALNGVGEGDYTVRVTLAGGAVHTFAGQHAGGAELTQIAVQLP